MTSNEEAWQQGLETEFAHAVDQHPPIGLVARPAPGDAALVRMFSQRLIEGGENMGRRREAPLAIAFHGLPLIMQI